MNSLMMNMMDETDREVISQLLIDTTNGYTSSSLSFRRHNSFHNNNSLRTKFNRHGRVTELVLNQPSNHHYDGVHNVHNTTTNNRRLGGLWRRGGGGGGGVRRPADDDVVDDNNDHNNTGQALLPSSIYWKLDGTLITQLDKLKKLIVGSCQCLPVDALAALPHLEHLELYNCYGIGLAESAHLVTEQQQQQQQQQRVSTTILPSLVRLEIRGGHWTSHSMCIWMKWVCTSLPHLEELRFVFLTPPPPPSSSSSSSSSLDVSNGTAVPTDDDDSRHGLTTHNIMKEEEDSGFLVDSVVGSLRIGRHVSFRHSLKSLHWLHSGMKNHGLQRFLYEVVPAFPSLSTLSIPGNDITSIQFVLHHEQMLWREYNDRNQQQQQQSRKHRDHDVVDGVTTSSYNDHGVVVGGDFVQSNPKSNMSLLSTSLMQLNIQHNPIMKTRTKHDMERRAFEVLLDDKCPFLGSLSMWEDWDKPIEGRLRINRTGGRILLRQQQQGKILDRCGDDGDHADSEIRMNDDDNDDDRRVVTTTTTVSSRDVPAGLWPLVLQRAYVTSHKGFMPQNRLDATGVYYLIRHCLSDNVLC